MPVGKPVGDNNSFGRKNSRGLNIGDNIVDEGTIIGGEEDPISIALPRGGSDARDDQKNSADTLTLMVPAVDFTQEMRQLLLFALKDMRDSLKNLESDLMIRFGRTDLLSKIYEIRVVAFIGFFFQRAIAAKIIGMLLESAASFAAKVEEVEFEKEVDKGTDKTNITRKPSKTGKHEHGNQKSTKEAKDSKPKPREAKDSKPKPEKVKLQSNGQTLAKKSQLTKGQIPNVSFQSLQVSNVTQMVLASQRIATLAIRVIPRRDPTAQNHYQMIEEMDGDD
ncbi:hypothetical protein Tco_1351546 [Tanacetum coccineum]